MKKPPRREPTVILFNRVFVHLPRLLIMKFFLLSDDHHDNIDNLILMEVGSCHVVDTHRLLI